MLNKKSGKRIYVIAISLVLILGIRFRSELLYYYYIPPFCDATSRRRLKLYDAMKDYRSVLRDRRIKESLLKEFRGGKFSFENDRVTSGTGYLHLLAVDHYLDNVDFTDGEAVKWLVQYELIQRWTLQTEIAREIHGLPPLPEGSAAKINPGEHMDKIDKKELQYMQACSLVYAMAIIHDVHGTKGWLEGRRDVHTLEGDKFWEEYYKEVLSLVDWEQYGAGTTPEQNAIMEECLQTPASK